MSTFLFDYHVMHDDARIHDVGDDLYQKRTGPFTIAHRDWSTPKARSTSFRVDSCFAANKTLLSPIGQLIVFKKKSPP